LRLRVGHNADMVRWLWATTLVLLVGIGARPALAQEQADACNNAQAPHTYHRTQGTLLTQDNGTVAPTLWIGVEYRGIYRSTDGGLTWAKRDTGLRGYPRADNPSERCIRELGRIAVDPSDPNRLYVLRVETPGRLDMMHSELGGVYETRDAGANWSLLTGYANASGGHALAVVAGTSAPTVFIGSNNSQASWMEAPSGFYNTTGVIFKSTNGGVSWTELDQRDPAGSGTIETYMSASQLYADATGTRLWAPIYMRSATGAAAVDARQIGFLESADGGATWIRGTSRLPDSTARAGVNGHVAPTNFNHRMLIATNSPPSEGAPFGQQASWYTLDGLTYQKTGRFMSIARYSPHDPDGLTLIGYDPFAGNPTDPSQGLYRSTDGGATWTRIGGLPPGVDNQSNGVRITNFVWHPTVATTVFASGSGGYVWRSTDSGVTWTILLSINATVLGGSGLTDTDAPGASSAVTGAFTGTSLRATWAPPTTGGIPSSYIIQTATDPGFTANVTEVTSTNLSERTATVTFGAWAATRYVRVIAVNTVGQSVASPTQVFRALTPRSLAFAATKDGAGGALLSTSPSVTVTVPQSGGPSQAWTATSAAAWLQITGGSGTGAGAFTVALQNPSNTIGGSTSLSTTVQVSYTGTGVVAEVPVQLAVTLDSATGTRPFGQVDSPSQNATGIQGAIGVTGWALDDVGVSNVKIYRNCIDGLDNPASCQAILSGTPEAAQVVFIGDAAFLAGARADVESAFLATPQNHRAGWGYLLLTSMLPNVAGNQAFGGIGALTLYAVATDVEGQSRLLGRSADPASPDFTTPTVITMANDTIAKPFGAIDTPGQGATVSGVLANFGWALTPDSNTTGGEGGDVLIPTNGSTMTVFIDSVPVAQVTYNQCRGSVGNPVPDGVFCNDDVANIFGNLTPQAVLTSRTSNPTRYRNLDSGRAAIGSYAFDTALLSNGLHTIAWSVTDSLGRTEGIGSRFFNVLNSTSGDISGSGHPEMSPEVLDTQLRARPAEVRGPAWVLGFMAAGRDGVWVRTGFDLMQSWTDLPVGADGRRAVEIASGSRVELWLGAAADRGFLVANGTLRDLPPGATLTGAQFAWAPPIGYVGEYLLSFVRGGERVDVTVVVR
jgi:hypothetical protein